MTNPTPQDPRPEQVRPAKPVPTRRPAAPAPKPAARPKNSTGTLVQWMLAVGSITAVVVGANGLARQDAQAASFTPGETLPAVAGPATVAAAPANAAPAVSVIPGLDLPPIPALPQLHVPAQQNFPARPAARSRSSR